MSFSLPADLRLSARQGEYSQPTAGQCPGYVQGNLIILPSAYAKDFAELCRRNPVACPLLGTSPKPGDVGVDKELGEGIDIRTDVPGYNVYQDGVLVQSDLKDVRDLWTEDSVAFLIGCSFTFEAALEAAGLPPKHVVHKTNVSMYRTSVKLFPSGVFHGSMVVSMRPYKPENIETVREITRRYGRTHGGPVAWGWDSVKALGVQDVFNPDFGDAPIFDEGEVPVFWGCGVTPQLSVMESPLVKGLVLAHAPGKMVCLDMKVDELLDQ